MMTDAAQRALAILVVAKMLPKDPATRVLGLPNRWALAFAASTFCVLVELWLNAIGALTWDHWWWNARMPWLIFLVGYLWFFVIAFWVHDLPTVRQQARVVLALYVLDALLLTVFGPALGWI